jgi:membrane carboxypeptidase/penicillin-binding protein
MRRQPGSAFKPFVYLAAIASKKSTTSTLLLDAPVKIELARNDVWEPQNYDQNFRGRVTLRERDGAQADVALAEAVSRLQVRAQPGTLVAEGRP